MGSDVSDGLLWVGLGVLLFAATKGIAYGLADIVELNTLPYSEQVSRSVPTTDPEDSISLDTLKVLSESPSHDISNGAIGLLVDRLWKADPDGTPWLVDHFSDSAAVRKRAQHLLRFVDSGHFPLSVSPASLDDFRHLIDISTNSEFGHARTIRRVFRLALSMRDRGRRGAFDRLSLLSDTMKANWTTTVIVRPEITEAEVMPWIVATETLIVRDTARGHKRFIKALQALQDAGMVQPSLKSMQPHPHLEAGVEIDASIETSADLAGSRHAHISTYLDGDADNFPLRHRGAAGRQPRFHEESPEETEVRRRRREAMVFHEGAGVIERQDIIQPRTT